MKNASEGITYFRPNNRITSLSCDTPHIIETYRNGTSWYRVYSDGWCEQGGLVSSSTFQDKSITLLKAYKDTNFTALASTMNTSNATTMRVIITNTSTLNFSRSGSYNVTGWYMALGYIS